MTRSQKMELKKYTQIIKDEMRSGSGRPLSLTWEMLAQIKALLSEGQFQKTVFTFMGIPEGTWVDWRRKGDVLLKQIQNKKKKLDKLNESEKKYLSFSDIIYRGKAAAIKKHQRIIMDAGNKDWRASKWFLEVFDKETFGQKVEVDLNASHTMQDLHDSYKERMNKKNGKG